MFISKIILSSSIALPPPKMMWHYILGKEEDHWASCTFIRLVTGCHMGSRPVHPHGVGCEFYSAHHVGIFWAKNPQSNYN